MYAHPCGYARDVFLTAVSPGGEVKWRQELPDENYSRPPAVAPDESVYALASGSVAERGGSVVYAFDASGGLRWKYGRDNNHRYLGGSPEVGPDGTVYAVVGRFLCALDSAGQLEWEVPVERDTSSCLALGPDGTIYLINGSGWESCLYALAPSGEVKWTYKPRLDREEPDQGNRIHGSVRHIMYAPPDFRGHPAIGPDGTLYVSNQDGNLYAFSPQGELKWKRKAALAHGSSPGVGAEGMVYVCLAPPHSEASLLALTPDGETKWTLRINGSFSTTPLVSPEGTIYVGYNGWFCAFESDGTFKWSQTINGIPCHFPALTQDGAVCVTTDWGYLYRMK